MEDTSGARSGNGFVPRRASCAGSGERDPRRIDGARRSGRVLPILGLVVVVGACGIGLVAAPVHRPDAGQILKRAEAVRSPEADYAVDFTLHVESPTSSWKERKASYTMIAHGKDYSLVLMRSPESFYPSTLLIMRGLYWLLLPKSERPLQLAPRNVLNGDISNGDLARGNLLANYEPRLDGEETVRGEVCWRLELSRSRSLGLYKRIRCWITKRHYRPWKFEYFGETGALLKVAHYEDYRKGALGVRPMRIVVENRTRLGETTTMTFSNLRKFDASGLTFTPQAMSAFRDAARAKQEADGVQAQPEEILELLEIPRP